MKSENLGWELVGWVQALSLLDHGQTPSPSEHLFMGSSEHQLCGDPASTEGSVEEKYIQSLF